MKYHRRIARVAVAWLVVGPLCAAALWTACALAAAETAVVWPQDAMREAAESDPDWAVGVHVLANRLGEQGRADEARAMCLSALEVATADEDKALCLRWLGIVTERQYRFDQAIDIFKQVIERYPRTTQAPAAQVDMACTYLGKARHEKQQGTGNPQEAVASAMSLLAQFRKDYPNHWLNVRAVRLMGWCYEVLGDDERAIAEYLTVANFPPRRPETAQCAIRAIQLTFKLHGGDSELAASKVVERLPDTAEEYRALADALARSVPGRDGPASAMVLERYPGGETAALLKCAVGQVLVYAGAYEAGRQWYRRVSVEHPGSKLENEAFYWIGWSYVNAHPGEAIACFQDVIAHDSDERRIASALMLLSQCYGTLLDRERQLDVCSEILSRREEHCVELRPFAHLTRGTIYFEQQRYDEARSELELVVSRWPGLEQAETARQYLQRLPAATG